jgi:predicted Na+-dependent transporter
MTGQPNWAALFVEWLHPAAIIFAIVFPLVRAVVRRITGTRPAFTHSNAIQDVAHGLVFPTFLALVLNPMIPNIMQKLDSHALQLAGVIAILTVIKEIMKPDRPRNGIFDG